MTSAWPTLLVRARPLLARATAVLASVVFTWQVSWLLTRATDKAEIGAWSVIYTGLFAVGTITRFGCETLAVRTTAVDASLGRSLARSSIRLVLLLSLAGGVVMTVLAYSRSGVQTLTTPAVISMLAGSSLVALNLTILAGSWMRALGYVASGALLELGGAPIATGVVLGLIRLHEPVTLSHVVGVYSGASWVIALAMTGWASRRLRRAGRRREHVDATLPSFWLTYWRQLRAFMVTGLGFFLFTYLAILVFGSVGADASAADYRNCLTLAGLVGLLPAMQSSYLMPRLAYLAHAARSGELADLVTTSTRNAGAIGLVVAVPLLVGPADVLDVVFGEAYVHAAPVLRILTASSLAVVVFGPVYPLMTMAGLEQEASRIIVATLAAGVVSMVFCVLVVGPVPVVACSVIPPLGFAVLGHRALRKVGINSGIWARTTA